MSITQEKLNRVRERLDAAEPWDSAFPSPTELRRLRQVLNFSQGTMALAFGVSRATVARYEGGEVAVPISLHAGEEALRVLTVLYDMEAEQGDIPAMFTEWDGPAGKHPVVRPDRFQPLLSIDREERAPFAILPWPSPAERSAILDALGWSERQAAVRFGVDMPTMRGWLGGGRICVTHVDYDIVGAQAGWSALAYVTGLPPAPTAKRRRVKQGQDA